MRVYWFTVFIIILNVPFGYWRHRVKKFSISWILAIHIPVILLISARFIFHIPFQFIVLPFTLIAFFLGQYLGGRLFRIATDK